MALIASPAAANPFGDCFERVAAMVRPHSHHPAVPHAAVDRVRRVGPRLHRARHAGVVHHKVNYSQRGYILRPIACGTHETVALMTPAPGALPPETASQLIAERRASAYRFAADGPSTASRRRRCRAR